VDVEGRWVGMNDGGTVWWKKLGNRTEARRLSCGCARLLMQEGKASGNDKNEYLEGIGRCGSRCVMIDAG
jgi:hypothetical protein